MQRPMAAEKPLHGRPTTKSTMFSRSPSNSVSAKSSPSATGEKTGSGFGGSPCSRADGRRMVRPSSSSTWRTNTYLFSLPSVSEVPTKACSGPVLATTMVGPESPAMPRSTAAANSSTVRASWTSATPEARATPAMSTGPADSEPTAGSAPVET